MPRLPTVQTEPLLADFRGEPRPAQLHGLVLPRWTSRKGVRRWERRHGGGSLGGDIWPGRASSGGPDRIPRALGSFQASLPESFVHTGEGDKFVEGRGPVPDEEVFDFFGQPPPVCAAQCVVVPPTVGRPGCGTPKYTPPRSGTPVRCCAAARLPQLR